MTIPAQTPPTATGVVVLQPDESRRLLGRAVARLPQVEKAVQHGRAVVVGGTTTRFVAWELTGEDPGLESFAVGWIHQGELGETPKEGRGAGPLLYEEGNMSRGWPGSLLERFQPGDVYIKGANALDPAGNAAILLGSPTGGTIGAAMAILMARGGELIMPVSRRKLIPSVTAALGLLGQGKVQHTMGGPVGYFPIPAGSATVITEVEAFQLLFDLQAVQVAAGGVGDSEGALVFHLSGSSEDMDAAWQFITTQRS
ncbi:MAG: hypothetical protein G8345_20630 [Magnetococcales bacterium]|nr:hypothetical protein [Magnetococcales bacterium]NGZ29278.1 hypothetical protein [Magnetococcales bacterium]